MIKFTSNAPSAKARGTTIRIRVLPEETKVDLVTIDFETYYDKDYSLSKMTTEAYIRDPRFEVIGVGVKVNNHPTDWYSGSDPGKFLRSLDYSKRAILCHNAAFDGAILSWLYNIKPAVWFDTLSMARPLHNLTVGGSLAALVEHYKLGAKGTEVVDALGKRRQDFTPQDMDRYAAYCCNDVELTYKLFKRLKSQIPVPELLVIDQTIRMYTEPVIHLDTHLLQSHLEHLRDSKQKLIAGLGDETEVKKVLMSNDRFAELLTSLGVEPPTKTSLRTKKTAWAFSKTDKGFTDLLEHPDPKVQAAVAARLGTKSTIEETRTEALIEVASRGPLPIMLNYYGAHTGRFSGGDKLNLQNLPSRGDNTIRRALRAPLGHKLIACDSSQIEARLVAWVAGQQDLVEAFRDGRDVYSEFASEVYGRKITKADKVERFVGKTCILGLGYGMGAEKFRRTLEIGQGGISVKIELDEAQRIVYLYRQKNHRIVSLWQLCGSALTAIANRASGRINSVLEYNEHGIRLPNNMYVRYPGLKAATSGFEYISSSREYKKHLKGESCEYTKIYGGKVVENLIQALASIVIREQMLGIGKYAKVALQVHDEIVVVAPSSKATEIEQKLVAVMSSPPLWASDLPVACESGVADNYGDT